MHTSIYRKPKTPFEVTYKYQKNALHTSTVSLVEAPTIEYYYYYYSIVQDARLHNVTMLVVANDFDDDLFI